MMSITALESDIWWHQIFRILESPKQFALPPHRHYFYGNLDELRDRYFQKVGSYVPPRSPRGSASVDMRRHCV